MDKGLATFTGRPPSLSRRYVNCQLPLDLSPDELMAEGEVLSQAIARLDSDGWNTDGEVYSSTVIRAWTLLSLVRDEILELSLGPVTQSNTSGRQYGIIFCFIDLTDPSTEI